MRRINAQTDVTDPNGGSGRRPFGPGVARFGYAGVILPGSACRDEDAKEREAGSESAYDQHAQRRHQLAFILSAQCPFARDSTMCRNIKTLANFAPPATDDEIRASALQFVRKLSGTNKPSRANEEAFNLAVDEVTDSARRLIHSLHTSAPPRNRDEEMRKARERSRQRFGEPAATTRAN